jgi:hypothetical protein
MRLSVVVLALFSTVVVIGCGHETTPVGPSSISPGSTAGSSASSSISTAEGPASSSSHTAAGRAALPFKGKLQGVGDPPVFEPPPSPYFTATLHADGQATLLGRFTMELSHRVNLITLAGVGQAVFTAANGDMLTTDMSGTAAPAGSPTAFTVTETHTVTGGTGRFTGAGGTFIVTRAVDFADPSTSGQIEGWITAPGGGF